MQILNQVIYRGWAHCTVKNPHTNDVVSEMRRLGDLLGKRVGGRTNALEEIVRPRAILDAHPRSLSRRYGLDMLPLHTELSHRPRPCRHLLLGCIECGSPSTASILLDWHTLVLTPEDLHLLESTPVLVRSGRNSFYSTILPPNRTFLRYDPGCLEAVNDQGQKALRLVQNRISNVLPKEHHWSPDDILIIDNWRILHGRKPSKKGSNRCLARILIDG